MILERMLGSIRPTSLGDAASEFLGTVLIVVSCFRHCHAMQKEDDDVSK